MIFTLFFFNFSMGGTDDIQISPGCLYHADDDVCVQMFYDMINKSQKEVMYELYNMLYKMDVQKSPGPKALKKITPQSVDNIILATKGRLYRQTIFYMDSEWTTFFLTARFYYTHYSKKLLDKTICQRILQYHISRASIISSSLRIHVS